MPRAAAAAMLVVCGLLALALLPPAPAAPTLPGGGGGFGIAALGTVEQVASPAQRMLPHPPGSVVHMTFTYGPHPVPAGWDLNRYALDTPFQTGYLTSWSYRLNDALTGRALNNMQLHIHHALWFRTTTASDAFIFGTGEERTHVDLDARSAAEPQGPMYGVPFTQGDRQVLVLMLHNKETIARSVIISLDVTYVFGTAAQIAAAQDCGGALPLARVDACAAGRDVHALKGAVWGSIFDVPRDAHGSGVFTYPTDGRYNEYGDRPLNLPSLPVPLPLPQVGIRILKQAYTVPADGTLVEAAGHVHPDGRATIVTNLGPEGSGCEADLDGDGYPGVTLFRSDKFDRDPDAWPTSEEFQMGITKPGFRAPLRTGDRLAQFGLYSNRDVATYQAMTFATLQVDPAQAPAARASGPCQAQDLAPRLVDDAGGDAIATVMNRPWEGAPLPLCDVPGAPPCNHAAEPQAGVQDPPAVLISGFAYLPGDWNVPVPLLGQPPVVRAGASLTFLSTDSASIIRHTVTSCAWPCNGPYTANYPRADGVFDSDRLGNIDPADGGSVPPDEHDDAVWSTPADLAPGLYSYFCRIHPAMRGAFEVVP